MIITYVNAFKWHSETVSDPFIHKIGTIFYLGGYMPSQQARVLFIKCNGYFDAKRYFKSKELVADHLIDWIYLKG